MYLLAALGAFLTARGVSLVVGIGGSSLAAGALASLAGEHRLQGAWASGAEVCGRSSCDSRALEHQLRSRGNRLSCSKTYGIFPDQGMNLCLLHWQVDFTTEPPGKPRIFIYFLIKKIFWPNHVACGIL